METVNRGDESLSGEVISQQPRYIISWLCIYLICYICTVGQNDYKPHVHVCTCSNFIELCTPVPKLHVHCILP